MATRKKSASPASKQIILIVEDESMLLSALVERLEQAGYHVAGFTEATAALQAAISKQPDLIITDLVMHPVDGFALLKRVREQPTLKDVPTVVLSNIDEPTYVSQAEAFGIQGYLVKAHHSLEEITNKITALLK